MTKVNAPNIDTGTGSKQFNSRKLPSHYIPENYAPVSVDTEISSMVSAHLKGIDLKLGSITAVSFVDQKFDADGVTEEYLVTNPFSATTKIDLFLNGILQEENRDWKRDPATNKVYMIDEFEVKDAWPVDSRILVRLYDDGFGFIDESMNGAGGTSNNYDVANPFDANTLIDVFVNGRMSYEDYGTGDYYRYVNDNQIVFPSLDEYGRGMDENNRILVRLGGKSRVDKWFIETEVIENLQLDIEIETSNRIDVYIGGILGKEGEDWSRDTPNNKVNLLDYDQEIFNELSVLVRVWI